MLFRNMLAKEANQRPQTMAEVVAELEGIAAAVPPDEIHQALTVELPAGMGGAAVATSQLSGRTLDVQSGENQPAAGQTSVLVVEPSRVQATIIRNYLQEQSLAVVGTATSGASAIEEVRTLRPRAVVSALYLPDLSGLELAQRIRSEFLSRAPGFILVTSEAAELDASALGDLHRVQILRKPFTSEQLSMALTQVTGASTTLIPGAPTSSALGKVSRSHARVMIVDDSATARIKVRSVLQELGFAQFVEVADGAQAVATAARESCDLIVTDYNMPLMDGRALVSYLKQTPATAGVPIVMVTTETDPQKLDAVRRLGVLAIVEKAFPASVVGPLLEPLF
jgi:two-component system chemotaxis response regulator CheY